MMKQAVQNPKGESGDGEKIHGGDSFPMIAQKGQPALGATRLRGGTTFILAGGRCVGKFAIATVRKRPDTNRLAPLLETAEP